MITINAFPTSQYNKNIATFESIKKEFHDFIDKYRAINDEQQYVQQYDELVKEFQRVSINFYRFCLILLNVDVQRTNKPEAHQIQSIPRRDLWNAASTLYKTMDLYDALPSIWRYTNAEDVPDFERFIEYKRRFYKNAVHEFDILDTAFYQFVNNVKQFKESETFQVDGLSVTIINDELNELNEDMRVPRANFVLDYLKQWNDRLRSQKMISFVKDLKIFIRYSQRGFDNGGPTVNTYAGHYDPDQDEISFYILNWTDVEHLDIIYYHELGHRVWFKYLSENARKHWTESLSKILYRITVDDVLRIKLLFDKHMKRFHRQKPIDLHRLMLLATQANLPRTHIVLDLLNNLYLNKDALHNTLYNWHKKRQTDFTFDAHDERTYKFTDIEQLVDFAEFVFKGKAFSTGEHISDYGHVNPVEAFAETFKLYLTDRPAIRERTMEYFKQIIQTNGIVLAAAGLELELVSKDRTDRYPVPDKKYAINLIRHIARARNDAGQIGTLVAFLINKDGTFYYTVDHDVPHTFSTIQSLTTDITFSDLVTDKWEIYQHYQTIRGTNGS